MWSEFIDLHQLGCDFYPRIFLSNGINPCQAQKTNEVYCADAGQDHLLLKPLPSTTSPAQLNKYFTSTVSFF